MRSVPAALNDELVKEANFLCHLVELNLSSPVCYTDLDVDLHYGGNVYLSRGMTLSPARFSLSPQIDKATVELDNVDRSISAIVQGQEVRGKRAKIKLAGLSSPAKVIATSVKFSGVINRAPWNNRIARIEILSPWVFWRRRTPRRIHQPTCPWPFKMSGSPCGYTGSETWCDQSFDRCEELSNTDNFGGFEFLPFLVNKEIFWGRESQPKQKQ